MSKYFTRNYLLRIFFVSLALFINGINVALARISCLGTDPFSSLNYAIGSFCDISMGTAMMIMNGILLVFCLFFKREAIGFGLVACMMILGNAADFWSNIIVSMIGYEVAFQGMEHIILRLVILFVATIMNIFFCSFYIGGNTGMSAYDALGYIIEKVSKYKVSFKYARIITDALCVLVAYILSKPAGLEWQIIGIGTIIMAFCTGPILDFFLEHVSKPFYKKICKE